MDDLPIPYKYHLNSFVNKDEVVFKGQEGAEKLGATPGPDEHEKTRQQMAQKQMK